MGSPVSVVVAEIVMQNIEEQALATYSVTLPLWLRYLDDTITAVYENKIDEFHEHLNENRILRSSLLRRSRRTVKYLSSTAW